MLRDLMRGGIQIWTGAIATAVVAALYNLVIARALGAGGYGLYTQAILLVPVVAIFGLLSLDTVITRFLSEYESQGKDTAPVLRGAFFVGLSTGLVTTLGYFVAAGFLAWQIFREPNLTPYLHMAAPAALFSILYWISLGAFRGLKRFRLYAAWQFLPLLLTLILAVPAVKAAGVWGALLAWIVPQGLFSTIALLFLVREMKLKEIEKTGFLVRPGLWLTAAGGVLAILHVLDRTTLAFFESSETVGFYGAALLFLLPVNGVATSIRHSMFPFVSESLGAGDRERAQTYFEGAMKYSLVLQVLLLIPLMGLGNEVLRLLLPTYGPSLPILQVMVYLAFPVTFYILLNTALVAAGETRRLVLPSLTSVVAAAGLCLLLIPRWHETGAVAASALGFAIASLLFGRMIRSYFHFPFRSWAALLVPALGILTGLRWIVDLSPSLWVHLGATSLALAGYLGWLFAIRALGKDDIAFLKEELLRLRIFSRS